MRLKKLSTIFLVFNLLFIAGCQEDKQTSQTSELMQVTLNGTDTFPQAMVGIWSNKKHGWVIKFEKNGYIKKIRHTIGKARLVAGQTSTFPLVDNGKGVIEPGLWTMQYYANQREMVVQIVLDNFRYKMDQGSIAGSSTDIFIGEIPADGETEWRPEWISYPVFVASTASKTYQDYKLPFDENMELRGEIVFNKIDTASLDE